MARFRLDGTLDTVIEAGLEDALVVPHHLHRQMLVREVIIKHAREILKANNYKHYGR